MFLLKKFFGGCASLAATLALLCVGCVCVSSFTILWGSAPTRRQATQKNMRSAGPQAPDGLKKGASQFYSVRNCLDQVCHNKLWLNLSDSSLSALSNRCHL